MKQRTLGKNGPTISAIGVGAMSFTTFYGDMDEERGHAVLDAAIEEGVTHIDTANVYGPHVSENVIGSFLAKKGKGAHQLFSIATKAGIARKSDTGDRYHDKCRSVLHSSQGTGDPH